MDTYFSTLCFLYLRYKFLFLNSQRAEEVYTYGKESEGIWLVNVLSPPVQVFSLWKWSWQTAGRAEARGGTSLWLYNSPEPETSVHVSAMWTRLGRNTRRPGGQRGRQTYFKINDEFKKSRYHVTLWSYVAKCYRKNVSDLELSSYPLNKEAPAVVSGIYES